MTSPGRRKQRGDLAPRQVRVVEAVQKHHRRAARGFAELGAKLDPMEIDSVDEPEEMPWLGHER